MPDYKGQFITTDALLKFVLASHQGSCADENGRPILTIVDLRTENHLKNLEKKPPIIDTSCKTLFFLLDDLLKSEVRKQIPSKGLVVTITETGNRDKFVMQYLHQFGYANIKGLLFGMRGWIKAGYPTTTR